MTRISYLDIAQRTAHPPRPKEFLFFTRTFELDRRLPNSHLVIYPDAGHGGVFQFHEDSVTRALELL